MQNQRLSTLSSLWCRYLRTLLLGVGCLSTFGWNDAPADDFITQEVAIDQRAPNALEAREFGLQLGEKEAFSALIQRIAPQDTRRVQGITQMQISGLVEDFEVFDEKQSQDRYRARVVYRFKKRDLERLLGQEVKGAVERSSLSVSKPSVFQSEGEGSILLIPVLRAHQKVQLWEENNKWRSVWEHMDLSHEKKTLLFPLGDLEDIQGVDAEKAWNAVGDATRNLAPRHKALQGALIARAHLLGTEADGKNKFAAASLEVELLWDTPQQTQIIDRFIVSGKEKDTEISFFERAARTLLDRLPEVLSGAPLNVAQRETREIRVPFVSPAGWFEIRKALDRLKAENQLDGYTVNRLKSNEAVISWTWFGDEGSLQDRLRAQGLSLSHGSDGSPVLEFQKGSGQAMEMRRFGY